MRRDLVSLRVICKLEEHPNADRLEIACIDGWKVVVGKGEFREGETILFFEADSLIPVSKDFEFLRKYCYINKAWLLGIMPNSEAFRIRTIKLRGVISQGLVAPLSGVFKSKVVASEENNITLDEVFGVIKYSMPEKISGSIGRLVGVFPSFIPKTKQERLQNIHNAELESIYNSNETFEVTKKYDGSSITIYSKICNQISWLDKVLYSISEFLGIQLPPQYRYGVCSHNTERDLSDANDTFSKAALDSGILEGLAAYVDLEYDKTGKYGEYAVQAELCGPGIQKNRYEFTKPRVIIFDVYDITAQKYLLPEQRYEFIEGMLAANDYKYDYFRAIVEYDNIPLPTTDVNSLVSMGEFKLSSGYENEGLVWKSMTRDFSFKAISRDYLLKED